MTFMTKLIFDVDNCKGCELCVHACPRGILSLNNDKINIKGHHPIDVTDLSRCIGCASCALMCPDCVITVIKED